MSIFVSGSERMIEIVSQYLLFINEFDNFKVMKKSIFRMRSEGSEHE